MQKNTSDQILEVSKTFFNFQIIQKKQGECFCVYSKTISLFDNFIIQPIHSSKQIYNITFIKAQRIALVQFAIENNFFK
ncbi:unnamed protein product (macronuclear) [Paramecium tetraurelia]|uniref:Uncharacterized protein n=1 Tax=Paramecium tetraurelia TaxID=5888 RepID=A0CMT4_PARTE|nr:uncharacterized protein GSPATT00038718001 [Paramecium tetraurelia]CAK72101.1 unnamed protein product [Paramecium tetraurelia]|eukprot:XP_001439498.1 hypothetical protein (macronuclear) [Paramecium tetraurelia strain d4-2]